LQVDFIRAQQPSTTTVLAHDIIRQLQFYVPNYPTQLLFSEYVPDFMSARTTTALPTGSEQVIVLDSPLKVPAEDAARVREVVLRAQPRVAVWVVNVQGARAIEHGYQFLHVIV
jgi:hypothetical protein